MVLTRNQKVQQIEELTSHLTLDKAVILVNFQGLKVNEIGDLRSKLREESNQYKVVKNTLLKIALKNSKKEIAENLLDQPLALVFAKEDEVTLSNIVYNFQKEHQDLKIVGGLFSGKFVNLATIESLALLPSREELYAKLVGSISAPISGLAAVLRGNLFGLVSVLKQYQNLSTNYE